MAGARAGQLGGRGPSRRADRTRGSYVDDHRIRSRYHAGSIRNRFCRFVAFLWFGTGNADSKVSAKPHSVQKIDRSFWGDPRAVFAWSNTPSPPNLLLPSFPRATADSVNYATRL